MPSLTRRDFLKLSAAATALASAGCSRPSEPIVPYAEQPEITLPGIPRFYASALSFTGAAEGVLVESNTGRPTKVEGNRAHPGSLGATSVQGQAAVLQLWDPERSKAPRRRGQPATRQGFELELNEALAKLEERQGEGLRLLTGTVSSPTLLAQLDALIERYPRARLHRWDPLNRDHAREGARLAFGRPLAPLYRLEEARAVLSLDCRLLEDDPGRLNHIRQYARSRTPQPGAMTRYYALESAPSLLGALADHRYALPLPDIERWLVDLSSSLRGNSADRRVAAIAEDLKKNRGLVLAGEALAPWAHALVHRLNAELGAPVSYVEPVDPFAGTHARSIGELAQAMRAGEVELLLVLEGNPVYDAPADAGFGEALDRVPLSVHLALYEDETSAASTWHLPATHALEHWSDARAFDGTAAVVQPLIAPLYGGLSPHGLLASLLRAPRSGYDAVRAHWRDIDWEAALRKGVIDKSAFTPREAKPKEISIPAFEERAGWNVRFVADQSVLEGSFANNAWLQELPRSDTKITWDNAALVSPASARALGVASGDMLHVSVENRSILAPAWVLPGHAERSVTLALGYGRTHAGAAGNRVGFNAYRIRPAAAPWSASGGEVLRVPGRHEFATTQNHARMEGRDHAKHIELEALVGKAKAFEEKIPEHSLYPPWPYEGYRWAMSVNLNTCVGCNACTIACQAENNIPTVGRHEVMAGREMHWIRVDRYYEGPEPKVLFQPVPCMHCENAPCEYVCPVGAPVHDSEGLNLQVYNRCIGTRFCSQNCPYKVRRFNFLQYSQNEESSKAQKNPEVTVRMRGVMEKCTYCQQRITRARIEAEKEGRRIRDGEVVTACQAACPAGAIVFGDLNDGNSEVNGAKRSPLKYDLLAELNTRPRTSYLGRVLNPNPRLAEA
ncbi:MAG: 4Fe-4S dicluster domain-containing protein [Betaproteobacteria bacterium]|nr:MAG: 4Fe-4S dicluster domain-containing protein [Betaproteobacteria bacterium]